MKNLIIRTIGAVRLAAKANAPTIMVSGGVIAMAGGAVLACRKTLEIEAVLAEHIESLEEITKGVEMGITYDVEHAKRDRFKVYSRVGFDMARLYALPGLTFAAGAGLVFAGHRIMIKRNATMALAFTGLKKAYDAYRANATQTMGPEFDQAMMTGHKLKEVIDPETGKVETVSTRDWDMPSIDPYNRVFEQGATIQWIDDLGVNRMFIANQQRMMNILLSQRKYLYLSEVYKALGFEETPESRVCGWKVRQLPDGSNDIPFVDLGLDKPMTDDWKYSNRNAIYLDINCQGLIVGGAIQKALENA